MRGEEKDIQLGNEKVDHFFLVREEKLLMTMEARRILHVDLHKQGKLSKEERFVDI